MKYMGSKRTMLSRSLGEVISLAVPQSNRFVDLFTGSGAVACYVAENFPVEVVATDLQDFATRLAGAVITREQPLPFEDWGPDWIASAVALAERQRDAVAAAKLQGRLSLERLIKVADEARSLSSRSSSMFIRAYGGWYFSPWQALLLDALRQQADPTQPWFDVAVAAVVQTASRCAASPGHTAQPFKSDTPAAPFLLEAWQRDVLSQVTVFASDLGKRHAQVGGQAYEADAAVTAQSLREGDLVFVDPPYSSVHYSRFYHVLESIARGRVSEVSGTGRYPPSSERPSSDYSVPTRANAAMADLLDKLAAAGVNAIVTFPAGIASNRLSGTLIKEMAAAKFRMSELRIASRFSTLGGNSKSRSARHDTEEMILSLSPK